MYTPDHFQETDATEIYRIISQYPLATIIYHFDGQIIANHYPLYCDDNVIYGHCAIANDFHRQITDNTEILTIFRTDSAYISPNWYPLKSETHKAVPTWNYQALHLYGRVQFYHDGKTKTKIVGTLTKIHEEIMKKGDETHQPWKMADAPRDYMDDMLKKIVGFSIPIERVIAKSKLSQNHPNASKMGAINGLQKHGHQSVAVAMQNHIKDS